MITESAAEFRALLPGGGRLVGLDVGTKTVGVATCDAGWSFASAAELVRRTKFTADKARLADIALKAGAKGWVIGLPLSMDGRDSPRTQSTRAFARAMVDLALPILLWDERWSTVAVERILIEQDMSRARRAETVDKMAAAHILQGAIDALVNAG